MKTLVKSNSVKFNNTPSIFDDLELFFNGGSEKKFSKSSSPLVNIKETENTFEIEMALPGYNKKDIVIKVENELLTISSEKINEEVKGNENFTKKEFNFEKFSRSFTLPEIVDIEAITAKNENGILFLTLPKNKVLLENKIKTISIS